MKSLPAALIFSAVLLSVSCATIPPGDRERVVALAQAVDRSQPFAESSFVESQGLRVHYRHWVPAGESGSAPEKRILLIHGFGSSTFSFRFVVPALLDAGWEVAAVDVPPFGHSDHDPVKLNRGVDRGELFWPVIEALGWKQPVLLGHSMGGLYASLAAQSHPERVRALILLAGAVPVEGKTGSGAPFFAGLLGPFLDSSLKSWSSVKGLLEGFAVKGETIPDEMVDGYAAAFQGPREADALIAWATSPPAGALDVRRLTMPVLALWGGEDTIVPVETGRKIQAALAGAKLVVLPGVGHLAHELQPEQVTPELVEFLKDLE